MTERERAVIEEVAQEMAHTLQHYGPGAIDLPADLLAAWVERLRAMKGRRVPQGRGIPRARRIPKRRTF